MSYVPQVRRLPVAQDVALHALVWGAPPPPNPSRRPPFLLVHGLSSNCHTWEQVADQLHRHGHEVAAIDLRGHGQSDKPDLGYDFTTLTDDLLASIDGLGLECPVVAGQSTGGNLAVELASRVPERVAGAVGIDGGTLELQRQWPVWEEGAQALAPPRFAGAPLDVLEKRIRQSQPSWSEAAVTATLASLEVLPDGTVRPWLTYDRHLQILRALWEHRPSALLPSLKVPLLVVMGAAEDQYPTSRQEEAERARRAGPHVRVEWVAGGHDLHLEHPARIADLLLDFGAAVTPASGSSS